MKKIDVSGISRRKFLGQMSCAAVGSTAFYSTLVNMVLSTRLSAQSFPPPGDYKATVCLFLTGGNDSFNMLVPREESEYADYAQARGGLALSRESLLPITDAASGRAFGLHPNLGALQEIYNSGDLAFLCNAGTLVEPMTLADWNANRVRLPLGLFSHADQIMHWQTSTPDKRDSVGWLGRVADVIHSFSEAPKVSMNISLAGANIMQTGNGTIPYSITNGGAIRLDNYGEGYEDRYPFFEGAVNSLLEQEYQNILQRTYAKKSRDAIDLGLAFNDAIEAGQSFSTQFPDTPFGNELKMIARSIAARDPLGQQRQTFFAFRWGWDHHDDMLEQHGGQLGELSEAVGAFWQAMGELGLQDSVSVFSASDFGRTLTNNGDGTDHGWGGNHFVLGGGIRGGRLYGEYPETLGPGSGLDTGRGRLIPTTSVDSYFAELALWLGAQKSDLPLMLPNIERFYDIGSSDAPLGMFG